MNFNNEINFSNELMKKNNTHYFFDALRNTKKMKISL